MVLFKGIYGKKYSAIVSFTSEPFDYARYANGALLTDQLLEEVGATDDGGLLGVNWTELIDDATSWLGLDSLESIESQEEVGQILSDAAYGQLINSVTNGGRLKNAAALRLDRIVAIIKNSANPGIFAGFEGLGDLIDA